MSNVLDALNKFGRDVRTGARKELRSQKKNTSKSLSNSITFKTKVNKNSFEMDFFMEDYGKYIDKGVKGSKSSRKAPTSPYKYTNKMPPSKVFDKWSIRKGIAPRSEGGQFTKRKSLTFAIARSIFLTGIETTNFFTKPFEKEFKELPDEIIEAYGLDVEDFLKFSLKNGNN